MTASSGMDMQDQSGVPAMSQRPVGRPGEGARGLPSARERRAYAKSIADRRSAESAIRRQATSESLRSGRTLSSTTSASQTSTPAANAGAQSQPPSPLHQHSYPHGSNQASNGQMPETHSVKVQELEHHSLVDDMLRSLHPEPRNLDTRSTPLQSSRSSPPALTHQTLPHPASNQHITATLDALSGPPFRSRQFSGLNRDSQQPMQTNPGLRNPSHSKLEPDGSHVQTHQLQLPGKKYVLSKSSDPAAPFSGDHSAALLDAIPHSIHASQDSISHPNFYASLSLAANNRPSQRLFAGQSRDRTVRGQASKYQRNVRTGYVHHQEPQEQKIHHERNRTEDSLGSDSTVSLATSTSTSNLESHPTPFQTLRQSSSQSAPKLIDLLGMTQSDEQALHSSVAYQSGHQYAQPLQPTQNRTPKISPAHYQPRQVMPNSTSSLRSDPAMLAVPSGSRYVNHPAVELPKAISSPDLYMDAAPMPVVSPGPRHANTALEMDGARTTKGNHSHGVPMLHRRTSNKSLRNLYARRPHHENVHGQPYARSPTIKVHDTDHGLGRRGQNLDPNQMLNDDRSRKSISSSIVTSSSQMRGETQSPDRHSNASIISSRPSLAPHGSSASNRSSREDLLQRPGFLRRMFGSSSSRSGTINPSRYDGPPDGLKSAADSITNSIDSSEPAQTKASSTEKAFSVERSKDLSNQKDTPEMESRISGGLSSSKVPRPDAQAPKTSSKATTSNALAKKTSFFRRRKASLTSNATPTPELPQQYASSSVGCTSEALNRDQGEIVQPVQLVNSTSGPADSSETAPSAVQTPLDMNVGPTEPVHEKLQPAHNLSPLAKPVSSHINQESPASAREEQLLAPQGRSNSTSFFSDNSSDGRSPITRQGEFSAASNSVNEATLTTLDANISGQTIIDRQERQTDRKENESTARREKVVDPSADSDENNENSSACTPDEGAQGTGLGIMTETPSARPGILESPNSDIYHSATSSVLPLRTEKQGSLSGRDHNDKPMTHALPQTNVEMMMNEDKQSESANLEENVDRSEGDLLTNPTIAIQSIGPSATDLVQAQSIFQGDEGFTSRISAAAYIGEPGPHRTRLRQVYLSLFDFSGLNILAALRYLCSRLYLKAESQQVDRIIETFSERWCACNSNHGFKSVDVIHTIVYSLIMLNTDLHQAEIDTKMTKPQFLKNIIPTIRRIALDTAPDSFLLSSKQDTSRRVSTLGIESDRAQSHARPHSPASFDTEDAQQNKTTSASHRARPALRVIGRSSSEQSRPETTYSSSLGGLGGFGMMKNSGGPLVSSDFSGKLSTWESQLETILKDFYSSIRENALPILTAAEPTLLETQSGAGLSSAAPSASHSQSGSMLRRSPSVLSKAPSETQSFSNSSIARGRTDNRLHTGRWAASKTRSKPRLYPPSTMTSSRRSSFDEGSRDTAPSSVSAWSRFSSFGKSGNGRPGSVMSAESLSSALTPASASSMSRLPGYNVRNLLPQSIGFANAVSQAIIREEGNGDDSESLKAAPLLEDESLELRGAPWAKEGMLKHKHHLDAVDRRAKDRSWVERFAVIEKGQMRLFSFNVTAKSLRAKAKPSKSSRSLVSHPSSNLMDSSSNLSFAQDGKIDTSPATVKVVGGGNWADNAERLATFPLRQIVATALPEPGYSKTRPHVWALSLPNGAVHLFECGTPDIVAEFVATANYWSARLSKEPLTGGVSNIEYGWSATALGALQASNESETVQPESNSQVQTGPVGSPHKSSPSISSSVNGVESSAISALAKLAHRGSMPASIRSHRSSVDHSISLANAQSSLPGNENVRPGTLSRSSSKIPMDISLSLSQNTNIKYPGDKVAINEWSPPAQSTMASALMEVDQLRALGNYVKKTDDELSRHNELRSRLVLAYSPRHQNATKAMRNWEAKSSHLLSELIKYKTYVEALQTAQAKKEAIYAEQKLSSASQQESLNETSEDIPHATKDVEQTS